MKSIKEDILQWFRDRPVVIQESARRILEKGDLGAADYDDLKRVCCIEVGMTFDDGYAPATKQIPDSAISQDSHSHRIEITSISNVTGVNALGPRNPLKLQEGLTVIYGHNGSGKSGYTRLLKQICGAKSPGTLHGNAFDKTPINQACRVEYKFDDNVRVLEWDSSRGISEQLSAVELYDSNCGSIYVTDENQLAYEPPLLNLMSSLILTCDHLSSTLDQEINLLVSAKPQLPNEYINTKYGKWYSSISAKIKSSEIESACVWPETNQENLESLKATLKLPEPMADARLSIYHNISRKRIISN
jgi:energy-coupling factor transporter ATP-binding protein EcfA2